jgi:hypothetical protein
MKWKDFEGSVSRPNSDYLSSFLLRLTETTKNLKRAGIPAEILTNNLPNTSLEHYIYHVLLENHPTIRSYKYINHALDGR